MIGIRTTDTAEEWREDIRPTVTAERAKIGWKNGFADVHIEIPGERPHDLVERVLALCMTGASRRLTRRESTVTIANLSIATSRPKSAEMRRWISRSK